MSSGDPDEDLAYVLFLVEENPGIWTAKLCRQMQGLPEAEQSIVYCGLCQDYANPRKRARAKKHDLPTLPGLPAPYQLHPRCHYLGLTALRKILYRLERECLMITGERAKIPDLRQARGWDWGTRWWPSGARREVEDDPYFWASPTGQPAN